MKYYQMRHGRKTINDINNKRIENNQDYFYKKWKYDYYNSHFCGVMKNYTKRGIKKNDRNINRQRHYRLSLRYIKHLHKAYDKFDIFDKIYN